MTLAANLGFPRIGPRRELKKALESYWAGNSTEAELASACRSIRNARWQTQRDAGIASIPSNDFSLYDHVLDTAVLVGAVPERYRKAGEPVSLDVYFALARGKPAKDGPGLPALEMTKWFDTNYHYLVPEFHAGQAFRLAGNKPVDEFIEARELGIVTRPVLLGPVTFLRLGKMAEGAAGRPLDLLPRLVPVYEELLRLLAEAGAEWVQLDEPCLALDLDDAARSALHRTYGALASAVPGLSLLVASYFGPLRDNLSTACSLPVRGLHVDLVRGGEDVPRLLDEARAEMHLSLGVVDGRNVWRTDLAKTLDIVEAAAARRGAGRLQIAPSCSLLHVPVDLAQETALDAELRSWLAFARQKLDEIVALARAAREGRGAMRQAIEDSDSSAESRRRSPRIHDPAVARRLASLDDRMLRRGSPYPERRRVQQARLGLPPFPTTTIGSFPQTPELRAARAAFKKGEWTAERYEQFLRGQVAHAIRVQEETGLDVLVHGEPERNDMVEYFGEQLAGFAFTEFGWVQSYGSRCVKPPIIFGDVSRPRPMTVAWAKYAQSLTRRPVKGMLTGPVTILQWSFVRDDQPRAATCRQIALAIRDEVADLEAAGIGIIQIDEPALREGLPLRSADREDYLAWSVDAFRLASSGVANATQIHTHMCYAEFNDIMPAVARLDADVISIESSRSRMELLDAFAEFRYPTEIGPGVYDIHSPRVPEADEMRDLLQRALGVLRPEQVWVNPDCGLKTRRWEEVRPALVNMVAAAKAMRQ
jgi:5-methyltetrahydropteroyltriglutamate--homocysteine methyltransferase